MKCIGLFMGGILAVSFSALGNAAASKQQIPSQITCTVNLIQDGSNFVCADAHDVYRVRLNGVAAPGLKQPHGQNAKKFLANMILYKTVRMVVVGIDRENWRLITDVSIGTKRLNYELVRAGWAWHYGCINDKNLPVLEQQARKDRRGLWADAKSAFPWKIDSEPTASRRLPRMTIQGGNVASERDKTTPSVSGPSPNRPVSSGATPETRPCQYISSPGSKPTTKMPRMKINRGEVTYE